MNVSPIDTVRRSSSVGGMPYTVITGSAVGRLATSMVANFWSVWNSGMSADTSHWYVPDWLRWTVRSVAMYSLDLFSCWVAGGASVFGGGGETRVFVQSNAHRRTEWHERTRME